MDRASGKLARLEMSVVLPPAGSKVPRPATTAPVAMNSS